MTAPLHRQFFGDGERDFALSPELILELERKTNAGIGALCQRVFARQFHFTDLSETIRLALIGGGEDPKRAQELVTVYAGERMDKSYPLALAILSALWFGPVTKPAPAEETAPADEAILDHGKAT